MLEGIKQWIITILIGAFIVNVVNMILPSSKIKPYINLVLNFIFVFIVLTPIINIFSSNIRLEDTILKSMAKYNKEYVDSMNSLANETGKDSLSKGYEDGLKEVLKLKLDEYGYELEDVDINGSDIENIKVKEKSSNKSGKEDIQSKEKEKIKQAFNESDESQKGIDEDKLKEDLIEILDVSIETIEID